MDNVFFSGWDSLLRTLIIGVFGYLGLVVLLRVSGKRTLSKLNAFDLVVTVALGSTLATMLLTATVTLADGFFALALLIGLQYALTWLTTRSEVARKLVTAEPRLLAYDGQILPAPMRQERISDEEVRAAVRSAGLKGLEDAQCVVLESNGTLSVSPRLHAQLESQP